MKEPLEPAATWKALLPALKNATAAVAIVAIVALALILASCTVDQDKLARERENLHALCQGALSLPLKAACARAGIDTTPKPAVQ